ncbi:MAG: restriction endonuclease subunit S [Candidatus Omnitrophica bacterium]|nr:restriction endonuclease subunit S [Candidatus Omnitrophota bacterium]
MKKRISQIAEIKSGYLFKEGIKSDKEGNVRVIQLKDVNNRGVINSRELQRISLDKIDSENFLAVGDVLLKAKTNKPVSAVVKEQLLNTIATAHYFIISINKADVLPGYLAWYLNQRPAQIYFDRNAGGTRIQVINKQLLSELEVVIPDLKTQEKIAKIYELHQREQDLVEAIKERKHALILAQLLSVISK